MSATSNGTESFHQPSDRTIAGTIAAFTYQYHFLHPKSFAILVFLVQR